MRDDVPKYIDQLLNHPDEEVRQEAALHLWELGDKRAVDPLIEALKHDRIQWVRREAGYALGEVGNWEAALALMEALHADRERPLLIVVYEDALEKIGERYHYYTREEFMRALREKKAEREEIERKEREAAAAEAAAKNADAITLDPSIEIARPTSEETDDTPQPNDRPRPATPDERLATTTTAHLATPPQDQRGIADELVRLVGVMASGEQMSRAQVAARFECSEKMAEDIIIDLLSAGRITGSYNAFTSVFTVR